MLRVAVLDHEGSALRVGGQKDHERADHPVHLLRVLVRREELAGLVDEQGSPKLGDPRTQRGALTSSIAANTR
ncbi:MAG TPA: hypothetical protein VK601_27255, partial [Kofleriaceae bacterium]|nr:hypothetical protein [Kofleriaceae bacterium]